VNWSQNWYFWVEACSFQNFDRNWKYKRITQAKVAVKFYHFYQNSSSMASRLCHRKKDKGLFKPINHTKLILSQKSPIIFSFNTETHYVFQIFHFVLNSSFSMFEHKIEKISLHGQFIQKQKNECKFFWAENF
jgi:hypothetical protein